MLFGQDNVKGQKVSSAQLKKEQVNERTSGQVAQNEQVSAQETSSSRQIEQANHESALKLANSQSAHSIEQDVKRVQANIQGVEEKMLRKGSHLEMSKQDHFENSHSADTQQIRSQKLDSVVASHQDKLNSQGISAQEKDEQVNEHSNDQVALNEQVSAEKTSSSREIEHANHESSAKIAEDKDVSF